MSLDTSIEITGIPDAHTVPLRILAAEDNPVFQSMLRTILQRWGYETLIVPNGNDAWEILKQPGAPRLAILDWMMPGMDGVEVCRLVRLAAREPYTYILLLTARTESQDLVDGIDAGADDYLTKPFNAHELRARLRAGKRILELQQQLLLAREALREQATHDGLTGLLNRSAILAILESELARSAREARPLSLLLVDLDRFKQVNDTLGHLAGDAVLREAARRMRGSVRRYDSVGRYGGEEFLIVLPGCTGDDAVGHAERIRSAFASETFHTETSSNPVTCSIGVAYRSVPRPEHARELVREADEGLYAAKGAGRNRVEIAGPALVTQAS